MLPVIEQGAAHAPADKLCACRRHFQSLDLAGGFTADVNDDDIRPVHDFIAGVLDAAAQVDFFGVEEKIRIEEADFAESFGADNGKSPGNPVNFCRLQWVCPCAVEAAKEARFWKLIRNMRADGCQEKSRPTSLPPASPTPGCWFMW
jgi:hypothetical protein